MKYFIYARKSSEPEDRQMSSNEDQVLEMKRIAAEFRMTVVDIITEAKSAKRPGRPAFNHMLRRIEKGEAEGILCWKLNRLARNPIDGGQISWLLQQRIIKHIQTYGRAYSPDDNVLMMQVEFGMANQFIKDLKQDVERGMKRKMERGWYPTKPPLGYQPVNRDLRQLHDPEIVPHPTKYKIVRHLWDCLLTGKYSIAQLKKEGDKMGLQKRDGMTYSINTYYRLFSNPFYTGCFYWTPFNGIRTRFEGKHKPMVSEHEFQKAQNILNGRGDVRPRINTFPYRGIIKCGECKGNVTAEQKIQAICTNCKWKFSIIKSKTCTRCGSTVADMNAPTILNKIYYRCTKRTNPTCKQPYILQSFVEDRIRAELASICITPEFCEWGIELIKAISIVKEDTQRVTFLKKRKTEFDNRQTGLIKMRADGELDKDQFEIFTRNLNIERAEIERELAAYYTLSSSINIEAKASFDFAFHCLSTYEKHDSSANTALLSSLGSNLTLLNKNLDITTHHIYKRIKECEVAYYSLKPSFEPGKAFINKRVNRDYYLSFPILRSKLQSIRTCLKDIILKRVEENLKHGREPYARDDDLPFRWE